MSTRFDDCGDMEVMPYELWKHNVEAALKGKRGQKALRDMREALLALPEKRLISGALVEVTRDAEERVEKMEFCAVGAFAFRQRVKRGETVEKALEELERSVDQDGEPWDTVWEGERQGLVQTLAWELAYRNDEALGFHISPEERWTAYMKWLEEQIVP